MPTTIVTDSSVNSVKRQLDSARQGLFAEVPWFPILLFSPFAIPFHIILIYAIPTPNPLSFIIVLTLKLFCIALPFLYVVIEVLCGPR